MFYDPPGENTVIQESGDGEGGDGRYDNDYSNVDISDYAEEE